MMINVNLRPGSRRAPSGRSFTAGIGERFRGLTSAVSDPLRLAAIAAWVVVAGFLGWTFFRSSTQLGQLEPRLEEVRAEHRRYQEFLAQKRREEAVLDSVVTQIRTIQQVDAERYVWPHVLDEVARALPTYTWLVDLAVSPADASMPVDSLAPPPVVVQLTGRTVDIQGYTRFMRQLEASPWLGNVTAVSANTVVEQGRAITAFVVKAMYTRPDPNQIRTVPVAESVR
jgi:Tfp pilus assembly protein PilN